MRRRSSENPKNEERWGKAKLAEKKELFLQLERQTGNTSIERQDHEKSNAKKSA